MRGSARTSAPSARPASRTSCTTCARTAAAGSSRGRSGLRRRGGRARASRTTHPERTAGSSPTAARRSPRSARHSATSRRPRGSDEAEPLDPHRDRHPRSDLPRRARGRRLADGGLRLRRARPDRRRPPLPDARRRRRGDHRRRPRRAPPAAPGRADACRDGARRGRRRPLRARPRERRAHRHGADRRTSTASASTTPRISPAITGRSRRRLPTSPRRSGAASRCAGSSATPVGVSVSEESREVDRPSPSVGLRDEEPPVLAVPEPPLETGFRRPAPVVGDAEKRVLLHGHRVTPRGLAPASVYGNRDELGCRSYSPPFLQPDGTR